jgi:hypothetical protein
MAFHEKACRSQVGIFCLSLGKVFSPAESLSDGPLVLRGAVGSGRGVWGKVIQRLRLSLPLVSNPGHWTKDAPSSDVKHWALLKTPPSAWTVTAPFV